MRSGPTIEPIPKEVDREQVDRDLMDVYNARPA